MVTDQEFDTDNDTQSDFGGFNEDDVERAERAFKITLSRFQSECDVADEQEEDDCEEDDDVPLASITRRLQWEGIGSDSEDDMPLAYM